MKKKHNNLSLFNKWDLESGKDEGLGIAQLSIPYGYKFKSCKKDARSRYIIVFIQKKEKRKVKEVI
jgi:hypothetical protein